MQTPHRLSPEIPVLLKNRRQERGLSLETVHRRTRIPVGALEALESNNPSYFSAPVYMHGFLQQYCDYLELDYETLPKDAPAEQAPQPARQQAPAQETDGQQPMPRAWSAPPEPEDDDAPSQPPAYEQDGTIYHEGEMLGHEDFQTALGGNLTRFMLAAAAACALFTMWLWRTAPELEQDEQQARRAHYDPIYEATFVSTLKASFNRRAWLRVDADGAVVFEGYAPEGTVREWKASGRFDVRTPEPNSLSMTIDNKFIRPELFVSSHTVIPVTYTGATL